jgi:hypothetical protein
MAISLAVNINNLPYKKSPVFLRGFLLSIEKNYFFSFFSILAFKPARMSLLSPKVAAGALLER